MAGVSNLEEASHESKPYRIIRNNPHVEKVITALRSTMNHLNADNANVGLLTTLSFTICHWGEQH